MAALCAKCQVSLLSWPWNFPGEFFLWVSVRGAGLLFPDPVSKTFTRLFSVPRDRLFHRDPFALLYIHSPFLHTCFRYVSDYRVVPTRDLEEQTAGRFCSRS